MIWQPESFAAFTLRTANFENEGSLTAEAMIHRASRVLLPS